MDSVIKTIVDSIIAGGPTALAVVGWCLYIVERYYVGPTREKQYRDDLKSFKAEYKELAEKTTETISKFMTILEVIKDRVGRS